MKTKNYLKNLKKGDKVIYNTLGFKQLATIIENNVRFQEVKIKLDFNKPKWVKYENIILKEVK